MPLQNTALIVLGKPKKTPPLPECHVTTCDFPKAPNWPPNYIAQVSGNSTGEYDITRAAWSPAGIACHPSPTRAWPGGDGGRPARRRPPQVGRPGPRRESGSAAGGAALRKVSNRSQRRRLHQPAGAPRAGQGLSAAHGAEPGAELGAELGAEPGAERARS